MHTVTKPQNISYRNHTKTVCCAQQAKSWSVSVGMEQWTATYGEYSRPTMDSQRRPKHCMVYLRNRTSALDEEEEEEEEDDDDDVGDGDDGGGGGGGCGNVDAYEDDITENNDMKMWVQTLLHSSPLTH